MTASRFELDGMFSVQQVPEIRRFIERLHRDTADQDVVGRLAMASHELFENAVKFSSDGNASLCVDVTRTPLRIQITTRNRANASDRVHVIELSNRMRAAPDMMAFYLDLMRRSPATTRGGLGLGRVAAEAEMRLELRFEDDTVVVCAVLEETT